MPAESGVAAFELRPSAAFILPVCAWLVLASAGCLACEGLPLAWRLLAVVALWLLALPGLRDAVMLVSRRSPKRIGQRGAGHWYIGPGALPARPSPHCLAIGPALWLSFDTPCGRRRACVVDRRLASRLRLCRVSGRAGRLNC